MTKRGRVVILFGAAYIASLSVLFLSGAGIPAAFLAMPGWLVVGALVVRAPEPIFAALSFPGGNLLLLAISAMLNVAVVYLVVHHFPER